METLILIRNSCQGKRCFCTSGTYFYFRCTLCKTNNLSGLATLLCIYTKLLTRCPICAKYTLCTLCTFCISYTTSAQRIFHFRIHISHTLHISLNSLLAAFIDILFLNSKVISFTLRSSQREKGASSERSCFKWAKSPITS